MSSETTSSTRYNIERLTDHNYRSWAQQMEFILDEKGLADLAAEVVQLGLVNMISLGSLDTREIQIGEKATVSIAHDSQGPQWSLDTDVKVKVVGWGFVEEKGTIMVATYVGHATSQVSGF
jgi:hypothetical protein